MNPSHHRNHSNFSLIRRISYIAAYSSLYLAVGVVRVIECCTMCELDANSPSPLTADVLAEHLVLGPLAVHKLGMERWVVGAAMTRRYSLITHACTVGIETTSIHPHINIIIIIIIIIVLLEVGDGDDATLVGVHDVKCLREKIIEQAHQSI